VKILVVAPYVPAPPNTGGRRRIHAFVTRLARAHDITLVTFAGRETAPRDVSALQRICSSVVTLADPPFEWSGRAKRQMQARSVASVSSYARAAYVTEGMQRAIDEAAQRSDFDITLVEFAQMSGYRFKETGPVVLDEHNVEYDILRRTFETEQALARKLYSFVEFLKFRREERAAWTRMDACVFTSVRDRDLALGRVTDERAAVVPNGVDTREFAPSAPSASRDVVFVGADFYPNADALRFYADEVLPLVRRESPASRLVVVGQAARALTDRWRAGVILVGPVPSVRPWLESAAVVVAPLRIGGGTRLKVLEAMAMARPVVATTIGAEGIDAVSGRDLLIADDPVGLARATLRVLEDRRLGEHIGLAGRRLVERRYDWDVIAGQLDRFLRAVLAPRPSYELALTGERVG
jgi:glycosyltransferase involved in cell wall biosynthesis